MPPLWLASRRKFSHGVSDQSGLCGLHRRGLALSLTRAQSWRFGGGKVSRRRRLDGGRSARPH